MNGQKETDFMPAGRAVDDGRPIRVTIIGAGVSGIALYIRLLQHVPTAQITIIEKNPEAGGTWYENRYPGVACDIPSHVYQYSFEPNTQWSKLFAPGPEILTYVQGVARKFGVDRKIVYNTKATSAVWNEATNTWKVDTQSTKSGEAASIKSIESEVVISAVGILNNWKWPHIEGLHDFEGTLLHSANWDSSWYVVCLSLFPTRKLCLLLYRDCEGKTVALLGCGSSAIQILPQLQKKCPRIINFIRGGTWVSQPFGSTLTEGIIANGSESGNYSYSPEELKRFANDKAYYQEFRKEMESFINKDFPCLFPDSNEERAGTKKIQDNMRQKLASKPGLYEALEPTFRPGCRRLTPGPGYLEALVQDNVSLVKSPICKVTKDGLATQDGNHWKVDAIVCATGFDCSHVPRFPIIGRNGTDLATMWQQRAVAYLSHSIPEFPNYFIVGGPNSATGGGSLLLILESVMAYIIKAVQKISREHILAMEVKKSALSSWQHYLDGYFPATVHLDSCTSWYKVNGQIIGLWPGSSLHAMKALQHPRWEDYEYKASDEDPNTFWIGNGWTQEDVKRGSLGYYVDQADIPSIPSEYTLSKQP